jgi:hypothetical protein
MTLSVPRLLSLVLVAVGYACAPAIALIWFPAQIDDLTFGMWYRGYQIDSHTPGVLIAAMGWLLLLLFVVALLILRLAGHAPAS